MRRRDLERRLKRAEDQLHAARTALEIEQKTSNKLRSLLDQQEKRHDELLTQYAARNNVSENVIDHLSLLLSVSSTYVEETWVRDRIDKALRQALVEGSRAARLLNLIEEKRKESDHA